MKKYIPLALLIMILTGCITYNKIKLNSTDFYHHKKVSKRIDKYRVYVHEDDGDAYLAEVPVISGDTLQAYVQKTEVVSVPDQLETKEDKKKRDEIHIYLKDDAKEVGLQPGKQNIAMDDVQEVDMYGRKEDAIFRNIGLIIAALIVGGLIIVGFIALLIKSTEEASQQSSDGSNSDSGSSDSGGSDSGGSDSGGSDSGGSDSDSGCYVATMVYGSYDAPEVLVLRKFRDNFLQKHNWGRKFISWYYANSPAYVERNKDKKLLNKFIRGGLNTFVRFLRVTCKW